MAKTNVSKTKAKSVASARVNVYRRVLFVAAAVVALWAAVMLVCFEWRRYRYVTNQASLTPLRELVIQAAEGLRVDAPQDPKTGEVYFPKAKLYIPQDPGIMRLTYGYYWSGDSSEEIDGLNISARNVMSSPITLMYSAEDHQKLFDVVPKLQACSRGILLTYQEQVDHDELELKETLRLNNGKDLYMYTEKQCPELEIIEPLIKSIQAY